MAGCTGLNIAHDELNETGPLELLLNVSDGPTNAWMSGQLMVIMRMKDIELNILVVRNIYHSFVQEELAVLQ